MSTETIEEWAARNAATMASEDWRRAEGIVAKGNGTGRAKVEGYSVDHCRALLAYRDKVAKGLTKHQREWLAVLVDDGPRKEWRTSHRRVLKNLRDKGLVCGGTGEWEATAFGREVARVLEAKP